MTVGAVNGFGTDSRADDKVATYSSRGPTRSYWTDAYGLKHYDNVMLMGSASAAGAGSIATRYGY